MITGTYLDTQETIIYLIFIILIVGVVWACNKVTKERCEESGGQVIVYTTKLGNACIYPVKQK